MILIALGSNVASPSGSPADTLSAALADLDTAPDSIVAKSRLFATPAFPFGSGPDFVNGAAVMETSRDPRGLLDRLHEIECSYGRDRRERWAPRTLDLDLLAYDDRVLPDPATLQRWIDLPLDAQQTTPLDGLLLPHPRLHERAFVLMPLLDVAPDWRHPVLGTTIRELADGLSKDDRTAMRPL